MADYYLGVDAGGSRTRAALATASGDVIAIGTAGPANFRTGPWRQAAKEIRAAVEAVTRPHEIKHVNTVCIGTAGLEAPGDEDEGRRLLGDGVAAARVILDTDAYVAWAGAFMGKPGIIILAGTGSICLAVDATGRRYRVGGWGPRFGDEGSAYTIAVKGVRQALEALDGRSQDTAFLDALSSFNGLALSSSEDIPTLTSWLYGTAQADATLAQFARCVDQLARQGNKAAEEILRAAGRDLAGLVQVARKRFAEGNPARVALGGSVLQRSTNVRRSLMACLDEAGGFELVKPAASPMIGAVSVALQSGREHMHEGVMERLLSSNSNVSAVEMQ